MKNFKSLKSEVEKVLQKYDKAKNNDKWLTYKVWCDMYPSKVVEVNGQKAMTFEKMLDMPDEQVITRIRRKFNELGLYKATDQKIIKARMKKERKIKQEIKTWNGI